MISFLHKVMMGLLISSAANATWFESIPRSIKQPDGTTLDCFVTGDQYARRLHDELDYTIVMDERDGYYYYAEADENGVLSPSKMLAGSGNPATIGVSPGYAISRELYNQKKLEHQQIDQQRDGRDSPSSGVISQINIFIRFADDPEFPYPRSYYDAVFQTEEDEPSLKHYFDDISSGSLTVNTYHYPRSSQDINATYTDPYFRSYYMPYSGANLDGYQTEAQRAEREHTLLANAVNSIVPIIGPGDPWIDVDTNDDGFVDAVSFVIFGSPGDWADLLWPHRWVLYNEVVNINNARVYDYLFMVSESWYYNVGVLCHEFGHVLGAPDYYQYDGGNAPTPIGGWDVMGGNSNPPQLPSAFTMWKYFGWVEPIEITQSGTYSLRPVQDLINSVYTIASPNSDSEYFLLEYRNQEGYDANSPGSRSGMLVYRINAEAGDGNSQGPPDEFYVYRPGGSLSSEGNMDQAPYNLDYGHTEINDQTDPSSFLYDNASGSPGGLSIYDVSSAADMISFTVSLGEAAVQVDPLEVRFDQNIDTYASDEVTITNLGDPASLMAYEVKTSDEKSFLSPQGGPDQGNYFWSTSEDDESILPEWVDISNAATELTFEGNDHFAYEQILIPFEFNFFGNTYNYLQINANGWVGWGSDNELEWQNESIPSVNMPRPAIFGFFDDLNPVNENSNSNSSGNIFYEINQERVVIWFNDVARWPGSSGTGTFDFQIILYSDGSFKCNYNEMFGTLDQATIGWQDESGLLGTQIAAPNISLATSGLSWESRNYPENGPDWLTILPSNGNLEGSLPGQQQFTVGLETSTGGMELGDYQANIDLYFLNLDSLRVPVILTVNNELGSKPSLVPTSYYLMSPYPNPFNPSTKIRFGTAHDTYATIKIFDINGRVVRSILDEKVPPGNHETLWNGRDDGGNNMPSGMYFIRYNAGHYMKTQKVVLLN